MLSLHLRLLPPRIQLVPLCKQIVLHAIRVYFTCRRLLGKCSVHTIGCMARCGYPWLLYAAAGVFPTFFNLEWQSPLCAKSFCCVHRRTHGILWLGLGFLVLQWGVFLHFTCVVLSLGM